LSKQTPTLPLGHVLVPAAAIGSLSILLVAGLSALRIMDRVNLAVSQLVSRGKPMDFPKALPDGFVWLVAELLAFGLAFAILSVPRNWRRCVLWITTLFLIVGWAPVLSLAAHAPEIGVPFIATLWSGVCAIVYASRHQMACDQLPRKSSDETR
jgi:hypothetical protein